MFVNQATLKIYTVSYPRALWRVIRTVMFCFALLLAISPCIVLESFCNLIIYWILRILDCIEVCLTLCLSSDLCCKALCLKGAFVLCKQRNSWKRSDSAWDLFHCQPWIKLQLIGDVSYVLWWFLVCNNYQDLFTMDYTLASNNKLL